MTVKEYAAKYDISIRAVYHGLYSGRIAGEIGLGGWNLNDSPPTKSARFRSSDELAALPDYELAIIWHTASICGDSIQIRNTDPYYGRTVSKVLHGSLWCSSRNAKSQTWIYKASGQALVDALKSMGFSGRKNPDRQPPPVDDLIAARVLMETRCSLTWALRYKIRKSTDKRNAYYTPSIKIAGSSADLQQYVDTLCNKQIIPPRKLYHAANGTTKVLSIASQEQLHSIYDVLAQGERSHCEWWDRYCKHIESPIIPYYDKRGLGRKEPQDERIER